MNGIFQLPKVQNEPILAYEPGSPQRAALKKALAEAKARRAAIDAQAEALPKEINGRGGKEPVRFGDWEVKGIASDF